MVAQRQPLVRQDPKKESHAQAFPANTSIARHYKRMLHNLRLLEESFACAELAGNARCHKLRLNIICVRSMRLSVSKDAFRIPEKAFGSQVSRFIDQRLSASPGPGAYFQPASLIHNGVSDSKHGFGSLVSRTQRWGDADVHYTGPGPGASPAT
jgi:hypothetical protein